MLSSLCSTRITPSRNACMCTVIVEAHVLNDAVYMRTKKRSISMSSSEILSRRASAAA